MKNYHALKRTNPKGPGQSFIGTCTRCGKTGLPAEAVSWECKNPWGKTDEQSLIEAIKGTNDYSGEKNEK